MIAIPTGNGVRYQLTYKELLDLIDRESRRRMHMSGEEFIKRLKSKALPETVAKRDIEMLVRLMPNDASVQQNSSAIR